MNLGWSESIYSIWALGEVMGLVGMLMVKKPWNTKADPLGALIPKGSGKEKKTAKENENKLFIEGGREQKSAIKGGHFGKKSLIINVRYWRVREK